MNPLRVAIIGSGKVAHIHAKALQALPDAYFVAVCGRDMGRTQRFADQYGVQAYTRIEEMLASARIDVVIVCTPHPQHAAPTIAALRAGAHVLVEKPLAASLADCDAMLATAQAEDRLLGTVSQRRFYPPCQRIRQAIDSGQIGSPILGTVQMYGWRDAAYYASDAWRGTWTGEGGGVLVNQAPHQFDLLLWYMGPAESVYGLPANFNHPMIEVEDTAVATIRFCSGALGSIVVSNSINPALFGKVHVYGSNGSAIGVQTDGGAMFIAGVSGITEPPANDLWTIPGQAEQLDKWVEQDTAFFHQIDPVQHFHERQIDDFLQAVRHNRQPLITGEDGRRTVELFSAIYRSGREQKPVQLPLSL